MPCQPPGDVRWFRLVASPLQVAGFSGAVLMHTDITKRRLADEERGMLIGELNERVKEMRALHRVSRILQQDDVTENEAIQATLEVIPSAFQFPEITVAEISLNGAVWRTQDFESRRGRSKRGFRCGTVAPDR